MKALTLNKVIPVILIVDDEPDNFDVIEAILANQEYQLHYASCGQEAIASLDLFEPDIILLDVMMPVMDGIEVCQRIRALPKWKSIPIIMVTALTSKENLAKCLQAGANDFITKPINSVEFRARLQSMLRIKRQHDQLERANALVYAQLEASLEGVIAADEQGRLVGYNQKLCQMWGSNAIATDSGSQQQKKDVSNPDGFSNSCHALGSTKVGRKIRHPLCHSLAEERIVFTHCDGTLAVIIS